MKPLWAGARLGTRALEQTATKVLPRWAGVKRRKAGNAPRRLAVKKALESRCALQRVNQESGDLS